MLFLDWTLYFTHKNSWYFGNYSGICVIPFGVLLSGFAAVSTVDFLLLFFATNWRLPVGDWLAPQGAGSSIKIKSEITKLSAAHSQSKIIFLQRLCIFASLVSLLGLGLVSLGSRFSHGDDFLPYIMPYL